MKELTALGIFIPLKPWILAVVEASQSCLYDLKRLSLLTDTDNITCFYLIRSNTYDITVNNNVFVADELAGCRTGRCNTETEHYVVQTALKTLEENLTCNTVCLGSLVEQVAELTLQNAISVLRFLLLRKLSTILRHLTAAVVAMLPRREVLFS